MNKSKFEIGETVVAKDCGNGDFYGNHEFIIMSITEHDGVYHYYSTNSNFSEENLELKYNLDND